MIFVTIGTQKQQFNRLFNYIDNLILDDNIYVQLGNSKFKFKNNNVKVIDFLTYEEIEKMILLSDFIITHGGGGTIFKALELNKKVIVVPRLKKYKEHINDHQLEIANYLQKNRFALIAKNEKEFNECILNIKKFKPKKYFNNKENFVCEIESLIDEFLK